jgi:type II secretory pathway component PulK
MRKERIRNEAGFVLPLVLIVSLIITTGLMALAARSWLGLSGSIRQSQSRQAREIAEAGLAQLIESLNKDYAYLLIKDLSNWSDNSYDLHKLAHWNPSNKQQHRQ